MNIVQTSIPARYPVGLAELRSQLNIDTEDYDARLAAAIAAATEAVETFTGRALITRTYSGYLNWWPNTVHGFIRRWVGLDKGPLQSVQQVVSYDDSDVATVFASTNYYVDLLRPVGRVVLRRGDVWPIPLRVANGIQIDWTAGYGDYPASIPEKIRLAILLVAAAINENRGDANAPDLIAGAARTLLLPHVVWS